ncbi:MAG: hypothetical protein ACXVZL_12260 [Gaiellaceae bacterium]
MTSHAGRTPLFSVGKATSFAPWWTPTSAGSDATEVAWPPPTSDPIVACSCARIEVGSRRTVVMVVVVPVVPPPTGGVGTVPPPGSGGRGGKGGKGGSGRTVSFLTRGPERVGPETSK